MWTAARERILAPLTATAPARGAQRPRSSALRTCCDRDAARASDSAANRATSSSIDCGSCRGCGFCCGFYSGDAASRHHSCATMRPWVPEEGVRTHPREVAGTAPPSTADRATGQRQAGQAPAVTAVRAIHLRASEACRAQQTMMVASATLAAQAIARSSQHAPGSTSPSSMVSGTQTLPRPAPKLWPLARAPGASVPQVSSPTWQKLPPFLQKSVRYDAILLASHAETLRSCLPAWRWPTHNARCSSVLAISAYLRRRSMSNALRYCASLR